MMESSHAAHREDLDVSDATFARPDLTTFARLDELGLEVTGQRLEPGRAVLACRVLEPDQWCRRCGCEGTASGQRHPGAGARAVRVATDDAGRDGPPVPVHRVRARVAPGHHAARPSRGRSCPGVGWRGRWRGSCVST